MAQRSAKDNDYQSYRVNPAYESDHEYQTTIKPSVQPQSYDQINIYDVPDDNDKPRNTSRRLLCIITVTIVIVLLLAISGAVVGYLLAKPDTSIERMSTLPPTSEDVSDTSIERISTLPPTSEGPVGKPTWTTWLSWSNCDVTCGRGVQHRSRTCTGVSQHNEKTCVGNETEQQNCAVWKCPDRDYICPYGDLNDNFDACECETDILQGLVTDENNRPLSHATVAYASRPYIALAITNSTGMFQIRGVCATSQPILVRKPMFTTIEANTTIIDSTSSYLRVELQRIELPFIIGQPEDKIRQTGESVKFCCIAESNTPITKYEWFRNSDIIESANANNESLLIHNLTVEDSGQYTCRVHNGGGVVYSEPAILTIASTGSNTGCNSEPRSKLIRLPSDCVQSETNKAEFDVGSCGQTECYGTKMDQTSCSDRQEEYHCCQPVQSEMVSLTCASYTLPVSRVKTCGCGECASQIRKIIGRVISAESGDELDYIGVYYNSTQVAGTHDGIFIYETATQARKITLTLKDEWNPRRVMTTTVVFEINNDLVTHRVIKMKTIPDPIPMESTSVENCLPLFGDGSNAVAELVIAPNSMYTRDGKMYSGPFNAAVINIDMRNVTDVESAPGDFTTVDVEGNVAQLRSFGMVAFAFTDATGNKLAIGGSSEVRVKPEMIPQCKTDENGDCDTSLWVLNEKTGSWEMASSLSQSSRQRRQNGLGSLDGNMEVIEYRWYNIDAFDESERCWAKVVPYDSNNLAPEVFCRITSW